MKGEVTLRSIRIQNVRSLKDTGEIQLLPINILVGQNSSGKSTFLRTLPLIKQSINKRTDGPLLWAGDVDDYVDFGSFQETITHDTSDKIVLSFGIPMSAFFISYYTQDSFSFIRGLLNNNEKITYSITIQKKKSQKSEYLSEFTLKSPKHVLEVKQAKASTFAGKILIDGQEIPLATKQKDRDAEEFFYPDSYLYSELFGFSIPPINRLTRKLFNIVIGEASKDSNVDLEMERTILYRRAFLPALRILGAALCFDIQTEELVQRKVKTSRVESEWLSRLIKFLNIASPEECVQARNCALVSFFFSIFDAAERYIKTYFNQVHYIAPLRATAERYYRLRNLSLSEVDHEGKNLAMFLKGLPIERMKNFQKWTDEHFGFHVLVEESGGHLSVDITRKFEHQSVNLSDTGFGYSQILPIITQLWDLATLERQSGVGNVPLVIAIEQPELHLHPALQTRLTQSFIAAIDLAKEHQYQLQLILETHSETIVNSFGRAIENQIISKDSVQVLFFERDPETMYTTVQKSEFNEDGYLTNWPIGFFSPKE